MRSKNLNHSYDEQTLLIKHIKTSRKIFFFLFCFLYHCNVQQSVTLSIALSHSLDSLLLHTGKSEISWHTRVGVAQKHYFAMKTDTCRPQWGCWWCADSSIMTKQMWQKKYCQQRIGQVQWVSPNKPTSWQIKALFLRGCLLFLWVTGLFHACWTGVMCFFFFFSSCFCVLFCDKKLLLDVVMVLGWLVDHLRQGCRGQRKRWWAGVSVWAQIVPSYFKITSS